MNLHRLDLSLMLRRETFVFILAEAKHGFGLVVFLHCFVCLRLVFPFTSSSSSTCL